VASGESTNFASRFAPANAVAGVPTRVEPVSAYAAQASAPSQGAVMTGRGLY